MEVKRIDAVARASGMASPTRRFGWAVSNPKRNADWVAFVDPATALIFGYLLRDGFF